MYGEKPNAHMNGKHWYAHHVWGEALPGLSNARLVGIYATDVLPVCQSLVRRKRECCSAHVPAC